MPPGRHPSQRRERCLWLAEAAARDRGLVGRLVRAHGSFEAALAGSSAALAGAVRAGADQAGDAQAWSAAAARPEAHEAVVAWTDAEYPPGLRDLFDPPPALYVRGRRRRAALLALAQRPSVAVVGARRPSPYGLDMAWLLGAGLARAGVNVVSGMALGIDAQAHVGALEGAPQTETPGRRTVVDAPDAEAAVTFAGVLGAGVRLEVPRTNAELFRHIERRGVLLSEYGWGLPPAPWRFPARNRLIAALADAVVVVEGRDTSGALHTATYALEIGREVLAVPGEAGRPLSAGPHQLLRDGAHLCESPADVLAVVRASAWRRAAGQAADGDDGGRPASCERSGRCERPDAPLPPGIDPDTPVGRVLCALRRGQHTADQLELALSLDQPTVAAALSALELDGLLDAQAGRYRLRRAPRPRGTR
jgi:DNA processing protein